MPLAFDIETRCVKQPAQQAERHAHPVRPAPEDPAQTLNVEPEDADLVTSQGAFVNAEKVEQSG